MPGGCRHLGVLLGALDPNVVLTSDGGGTVTAARRPVVGIDNVSRLLTGILTRLNPAKTIQPITLNGELGIGVFDGDRLSTAVAVTFDGERAVRLDLIVSPLKLPLPHL